MLPRTLDLGSGWVIRLDSVPNPAPVADVSVPHPLRFTRSRTVTLGFANGSKQASLRAAYPQPLDRVSCSNSLSRYTGGKTHGFRYDRPSIRFASASSPKLSLSALN